MKTYPEFLAAKAVEAQASGFSPTDLSSQLFAFQHDLVAWAVRRGKAAIFADCGLGKTPTQLEWARQVAAHTGKPILIFAPLAVSQQTKREGDKFSIPVQVVDTQYGIDPGINITNYEKLHHFPNPQAFAGLVLDESSILKSFDGKTRKALTDFASVIPYRLACTATPAPNDYMELGNHAEFLGIMKAVEMLAMFFTHDGGHTSQWRLKRHAQDAFWKWMASWAVALRQPSDLGYADDGFKLPPLEISQTTIDSLAAPEGFLFPVEAVTLRERQQVRRESTSERVAVCAKMVNASPDNWLIWCNLNYESTALAAAISGAVEVTGSDSSAFKERSLLDFAEGRIRVLVTKPGIAGFGMNFQNCSHIAFVGLSDSYEQFYQAVRRSWRFGQTRPVECHIITAAAEGAVVRNIQRKERQAMALMEGMVGHMKNEIERNLRSAEAEVAAYETQTERGQKWTAHLGDAVEWAREMAPESVDFTIFSPPFASLYTYSNSERDMGNSRDYAQFETHFSFLIGELFRVTRPGRNLSFHCMNLPISKEREGYIGLRDFRGELIRMFLAAGWIYHSEVCIWKDPVTAMQRTKALGLLYKQLCKDSVMSRQGIADYLVTMRKSGVNPHPVGKAPEDFPLDLWQRYASPVWMDIDPSETLAREEAREAEDERHICPLQLEVIRRAVRLWSNPGDLVFSPFMGIGSEGHVAIELGRRFLGMELKRSYWEQAVKNLTYIESHAASQLGLGMDAPEAMSASTPQC